MPDCGSQIILCDLPVHYDTYSGCSHGCAYCFTQRKRAITNIKPGGNLKGLASFIGGNRKPTVSWCEWAIPLHWGSMSDPFQPAELEHHRSLDALRLFAKTGYPFVFSTKATLPTRAPYLDLLRDCNAVAQMSMVSPQYDQYEPGAPTFRERLDALPVLAQHTRRLIVRVQPYAMGLLSDVLEQLPRYRDAGVHGVTIEGMKRGRKRPGMVRVGGDWCYQVGALRQDYERIKAACRKLGLAFYCAENRLRAMGDDPCCCGVADLPGFRVNVANMNHMNERGQISYTDQMGKPGTGKVFRALLQDMILAKIADKSSYEEMMEIAKRTQTFQRVMGLVN